MHSSVTLHVHLFATMARFHRNSMLFASMSFSFSLMNSVFTFYYVKIFLNQYHVSQTWFDIAQVIYLVWNAFNDPLFAYWQDNSSIAIFRSRRLNILYGAPLFALSFLLPWFAWGDYADNSWLAGLHLLVALSCYDALFTLIGLAMCALYAEISTKHEDRLRLTKYSQFGSILGSSSVFFSQVLCDGLNNMEAFKLYVVLLALISWATFHYAAKNLRTNSDNVPVPMDIQTPSIPAVIQDSSSKFHAEEDQKSHTAFTQFKQICSQKNFIIFVTVNFMQIFQTSYLANFFVIFGDELVPDQFLSPFLRKCVYGSAFMVPQILVLLMGPLVSKKGYYRVILWSFYFKIVCSVVIFVTGQQEFLMLAFVVAVMEAVLSPAIFAFFNIAVSDIIDADQETHKRRLPLSSSVFAYNALFTKPAQSFSPMLIVAILDRNHYQDSVAGDISPSDQQDLQSAMCSVVCAIPLVIGLLQVLVWRPYSIRDTHVTVAKHVEM